jgi:hypothetical protein
MYLKNKSPRISNAKIKEGVCGGPQIQELIQDIKFEDRLSEVEKSNMETIFSEIKNKNIPIWWLILYNPNEVMG